MADICGEHICGKYIYIYICGKAICDKYIYVYIYMW